MKELNRYLLTGLFMELQKADYGYFWVIDEAFPQDVLKQFADRLADRKTNIYWQTRSRIDKGFTSQVCDSLAKAGLKEIRFGLEQFHSAGHCPSLTLEPVAETYYSELEKVFYLHLVCLTDLTGHGSFMGEE